MSYREQNYDRVVPDWPHYQKRKKKASGSVWAGIVCGLIFAALMRAAWIEGNAPKPSREWKAETGWYELAYPSGWQE